MNKFLVTLISLILSLQLQAEVIPAIVTSGGVSLGSYEAGFLYYAIENSKKFSVKTPLISTGASAGSINSFISAIHKCKEKIYSPSESLFWKSWIPLNIKKLTESKEKKANALFTRQSILKSLAPLKAGWDSGLIKGCTVYLGVTATRRIPLTLKTKLGLQYQRSNEDFAIKIVGQGPNRKPIVENLKLIGEAEQILLPFNQKDRSNYDTLINLLMASSSFPIAFAPTKLSYCFSRKENRTSCSRSAIKTDLFIDGGVYDNNPLELAYKISKTLGVENETQFFFLDPDLKNYPTSINKENGELDEGILKELSTFSANFISTARQKELNNFLTDHPRVRNRTFISKGSLPLASKPFYGFFGFFDKNFRVFDFNLGMIDAKKLFESNCFKHKGLGKNKFDSEWAAFTCLNHFLATDGEVNLECSRGPSVDKDQMILAIVSIEKLYSQCRKLDRTELIENKLCKRAMKGESPSDLIFNLKEDWEKKENESDVNFTIRRLQRYRFKFVELGLTRGEAEYALYELKNQLAAITKTAAKVQPGPLKYLMGTFSSPLINSISYDSPEYLRDFTGGHNQLEVSASHTLNKRNKLLQKFRFTYAGGITGLDTMVTSDDFASSISGTAGFLYEIPWITGPKWQFRLGLRSGYQVPIAKSGCRESSRADNRFATCRGILAQALVSISYLDLVKVKFLYQGLPTVDYDTRPPYNFATMLGLNF